MSFRNDIKDRRWLVQGDGQTTHLLMDGSGKLCVPDAQAGLFLNVYFTAAVVRGEAVSVVEQKSPVFRLFFDLDIRLPDTADYGIVIRRLSTSIWKFVSRDFFILESTGTSMSETTTSSDSTRDRMIVCTAPLKVERPGVVKAGCHLVFPSIFVNSPIAIKCREGLLQVIDSLYASIPQSTSAQSVTQAAHESDDDVCDTAPAIPLNSWRDVIDDSVYKGSGLRMIWSHKGRHEARAYVPVYTVDSVSGVTDVVCDSLTVKREYVHDCSIRTTTGVLTPCRGGEHQIADDLNGHMMGGASVSGRSQSMDLYSDAIADIERALPSVYTGIRFLKAFVTPNTVYLKTNSRYCLNVHREHRTSTMYVAVTRHGMMVRCYSRKDEYGCSDFTSPIIPLPDRVLRVFFPDDIPYTDTIRDPRFESIKKRRGSSTDILLKSPLFHVPCKRKKR
jgi:hypothetical protein